jgi:hypothetical protein
MYRFEMCVLGQTFGGNNCSIAVDKLLSAFAVVSHRVAHWLKPLLFGSIWLQSHLVEVFL